MRTQILIHAANPVAFSRDSASSTHTGSTIVRLESERGRVTTKTKDYRQPRQSTELREVPRRRSASATLASRRWGVVLAGGDGNRLRELTQKVWGDCPKQFCPILSNRTLLEETRLRAERSIPSKHLLFSVMRAHEQYYLPSLGDARSQTIVQPFNRGTAPAILYALLRIAQADANAIVSIFPCDHYYSSESAFTAALESAFEIAEQRDGSVILLAAQPNQAEVEYGWIEIGEAVDGHAGLFQVQGFQEKPPLALAQALLKSASLWNTFVIVGRARAMLEMAWATVPTLLQVMKSRGLTSRAGAEDRIPESIYGQIAQMDFSRHILALATNSLLAFRLKNIKWSDLGNPYRVLVTILERDGDLPFWAKLFLQPEGILPSAAAAA
jgi:mannose-1-phosphate guanylyltransferase